MIEFRLAAAALLAALAPAAASAATSYPLGPLHIGPLRAEPIGGGAYAVYGPLFNVGIGMDALTKVTAPPGASVQVVRPRPQPLPRIPLPPGQPVTMGPWTLHLELAGIGHRPNGSVIQLGFTFARAGQVAVGATVADRPAR